MKKADKEIKEKVDKVLEQRSRALKTFNKKDEELRKLQKICSHSQTTHYPRPVAEADSFDICKICNAIIYT